MIKPVKLPSKSANPPNVLTEEQRLCNEALTSHAFDEITDEQWIAMCEQVAQGARDSRQAPEDMPDAARPDGAES